MTAPILYCGDTSLAGAASYLAGVLTHWGLEFEYRPSDQSLLADEVSQRKLVILSDFPSTGMDDSVQTKLLDEVRQGTGLLMIGGWESFHGLGGDWDTALVAEALPVEMSSTDDRLNCDHPVLLRKTVDHPITNRLPFAERPPVVGGFNRFAAKSDATVLLEADRMECRHRDGEWQVRLLESHPMLVVGQFGRGRTGAVATDAAPHWVGGFVDWGSERVQAQAADAEAIEVGNLYADFWRQLVSHISVK
ncbi:MAG: glutamine amidotransferase [Planctomycetota bacterium]|nr:glutamine amidotransferase [Planctomycetota bacterium]